MSEPVHSPTPVSISSALLSYIDSVGRARSKNTVETYRFALGSFARTLVDHKLDLEKTGVSALPEEAVAWFADDLKGNSPATEQLYLTAVRDFFQFLAAEGLASPNLPRVNLLIKQRGRRPGVRLPQFPREQIEAVLDYAGKLIERSFENDADHLINLRDRAFLLTLADTGLRVHEACNLRRGDIDWHEARAVIVGKGDRQAVVRFSQRSLKALKDYLAARAAFDGASGKSLTSLPLFARHDRGAGKKVKRITTVTGRKIVAQRVKEAIGGIEAGSITPHSFRHYFVTTVLLASGNLKLAQELARHRNIAVTQRYAHLSDDLLDQGYSEIFDD